MRRLILLSILLIPVSLFAQNQVKETGLTEISASRMAIDLENYKQELVGANKRLDSATEELIVKDQTIAERDKEIKALKAELARIRNEVTQAIEVYQKAKAARAEALRTEALRAEAAHSEAQSVITTTYSTESPENTYISDKPRVRASQSRTYHTGTRGGCFYYTSGGNKAYVDRSLCK